MAKRWDRSERSEVKKSLAVRGINLANIHSYRGMVHRPVADTRMRKAADQEHTITDRMHKDIIVVQAGFGAMQRAKIRPRLARVRMRKDTIQ